MKYFDSKTRKKNREDIVNVATDIFIEKGIADATIKEISEQLNIQRKTFYSYFSTKEELANYILYLMLLEFYKEGFSNMHYKHLDNGYDKVVRHFERKIKAYENNRFSLLFAVHFDYYFTKTTYDRLVEDVYKELDITNPVNYVVEGINDGSILSKGRDAETIFYFISHSLGAYALRLISRGYKKGILINNISLSLVYKLLEGHKYLLKHGL